MNQEGGGDGLGDGSVFCIYQVDGYEFVCINYKLFKFTGDSSLPSPLQTHLSPFFAYLM